MKHLGLISGFMNIAAGGILGWGISSKYHFDSFQEVMVMAILVIMFSVLGIEKRLIDKEI